MKDLWVFTGPGSDDVIPHESKGSSSARDVSIEEINRAHLPGTAGQHGSSTGIGQHRRLLSEPTGLTTYVYPNIKATTEQGNTQKNFSLVHGYRAEYLPAGPTLLRKPAPRAQVPVSIVHEADPPGTDGLRAYLPSMISNGVEDMTGVGANGLFLQASQTVAPSDQSERTAATSLFSSRRLSTPSPTRPQSPLRPVVSRQKTPPLLTCTPIQSSTFPMHDMPHVGLQDLGNGLLGSEISAESAASHTTDTSSHIPIQWTGDRDTFAQKSEGKSAAQTAGTTTTSRRKVSSAGPMIYGSLRPGPIEEQGEDPGDITGLEVDNKTTDNKTPPIHEVTSRIASPELTRPDIPLRKSEAALVGLIKDTSPVPALPTTSRVVGTDSHNTGKGQGWVLVNVGDSLTGSGVGFDESLDSIKRPEGAEHVTPSPHAKAIAVIDALDNKSNGKDKSAAFAPVKKRFFYLGRKNLVRYRLVDFLDYEPDFTPIAGEGRIRRCFVWSRRSRIAQAALWVPGQVQDCKYFPRYKEREGTLICSIFIPRICHHFLIHRVLSY